MTCLDCSKPKENIKRARCNFCLERNRVSAAKVFNGNPQRYQDIATRSRAKLRQQVIEHYGGQCVCCGESQIEFLCFDHVDGKGAEHRRELTKEYGHPLSGSAIIKWIKDNDYPDILQVLCWNCNAGKRRGRLCPHQEEVVNAQ